MPGPNYTREFGYNEEAQLLSISHSGTLAYQYAYGADGNRRWGKDIANNAWTGTPAALRAGPASSWSGAVTLLAVCARRTHSTCEQGAGAAAC